LENVLLGPDQTVKIADFGFSRWMSDGLAKTHCGTPQYSSPEIARGDVDYNGCAVDVWSAGVILYTMLTGHWPFDGDDKTTIYEQIKKGEYFLPEDMTDEMKDLLSHMICLDSHERWSTEQILHTGIFGPYEAEDVENADGDPPGTGVDDKFLEMLVTLGYETKDKARDALLSGVETPAKRFRRMRAAKARKLAGQIPRDDGIGSCDTCAGAEGSG
jgi:serine/threonine protein kinase